MPDIPFRKHLLRLRPASGKRIKRIEVTHDLNEDGTPLVKVYTDSGQSAVTILLSEAETKALSEMLIDPKSFPTREMQADDYE